MKLLKIIGIALIVAVVIYYAGTARVSRMGTPKYRGEVKVAGTGGEVTILRDEFGIPHISGETEKDVYFALGYAHAQERLFQMNNFRLYSQGRLAEISGDVPMNSKTSDHASILAQDKFYRAVGFKLLGERGGEVVDAASMVLLNSYCAGINSYMKTAKNLPPEFLFVPEPEEWKPSDVFSMGRLIAWFLSHNWDRELIRLQAIGELGLDRGWALLPKYPDDGPYIIDPSVKKYEPRGKIVEERPLPLSPEVLNGAMAAALLKLGDGPLGELVTSGFGSNNWVVSGARSVSGHPILSNDPHLQHMLPSIFYQAHLVSKDGLDVIGVTFPGMPFVVLGHNRRVAWGATTTRADCQDLFVEKVNPDNPDEYLHNGEWRKFEKREEVFKVKEKKGFHEEKITVRTTVHGPVISDVAQDFPEGSPPVALAWSGHFPTNDVLGFFALSRAESAAEVRAALATMGMPIQNWVYADDSGNIGYYAGGLYPLRARGDGTLPVPGWTGDYDWTGFVPPEELPLLENPSNGAIFSANNVVLPERDYPYIVSFNYELYRAARIKQLLESKEKFSVEDMAKFQHDRHSLQGERLAMAFAAAFENKGDKENALAAKASEILRDWNHEAAADSAGAAVFYTAYKQALILTFKDELSPELLLRFMKTQGMDAVLDQAFETGDSLFFDNTDTPETEGRDDILARAVEEAADALKKKLGDDPAKWRWGSLHRLMFLHPMGTIPVLNKVFPAHFIESAGGRDTVFLSFFMWTQDVFNSDTGPCFRQIIDMGDIPGARMIIDTGQSGHPSSPHIFDQNAKWLGGGYIPMEMDLEKVKTSGADTLVLKPE